MAAPSQLVGRALGHYRIIEQIGAGGMGVVYRAHDEQLDRDVAIKVLPVGTLTDEVARKRFRKEALALAKLNHPNVATVHEFGSQNDTDFLVTEYIPGVTLDEKLATGALPLKEVGRVGIQLAQGLSAAHDEGIVHRDLKPANLRLTPDGRLKILDFGLAQLIPRGGGPALTATLSQSQAVSGTLPYMAPEQLRAEVTDARSDIWAAGAVLYEMATGKRAFPESNGPLLINAILNRDPELPSKLNRQVSPALENVIIKALDKDPGHRYQTVRDLGGDLERLTAEVSPLAEPRRHVRWRLIAAGSASALLALTLVGYIAVHHRKPTESGVSTAIKSRRSVAVLGFKNLAGKPELAWFSTALSEMLTTELTAGEQVRIVPGESVAQMKISLALPEADSYSKETLAKIRQNLATDEVVLGSYVPVGNGLIRLDLRLQDAVAGETLASISEKGSETQLDELANKAGTELRAKLGVDGLSEAQSAAVKASVPSNPEAARLYVEGLTRLRVLDSLGARGLLEKAVALEPSFALSHGALATAWEDLGYNAKAKEQAK
jgi:serine/threonine protein kinase